MRADAVGGMLADALQAPFLDPVDAKHAAAGIGGVVFGAVEPVAAGMKHAMAVEMPVRGGGEHLQQGAVTAVEQVAFTAGPAPDEHHQRQVRMGVDVVATFLDWRGEHAAAIEAIANGIVATVRAVASGEEHRCVALARERPATDGACGEQGRAKAEQCAALHAQSPSWALKPICTPRARASSVWCRRCSASSCLYSADS